ncbi:class I adenylate-forming enzyme family protein [Bhargavaea cecembensis]|uniref:class I adenylate-forming enzyme family protein n=1 Tax=Bhargavaea cecembensis TaxID=394098 RepID=UPI00058DBDBE|nr:AMP-binding protein [Bhargavaea cecembensis]
MNSSEMLALNGRKYADGEAVVGMGRRVTWKELDRETDRLAGALKERGIGEGDKVALFMPNVPEFVTAYFAVQRVGAIVVPLNVKLAGAELEYILSDADAAGIIAHELVFGAVRGITGPKVKIKTGEPEAGWESFADVLAGGPDEPVACDLPDEAESTILYTSGTTGKPKGVLFSYKNIHTVSSMICTEFEMKPESRLLIMMPLSHSAPLHLFLMAGVTVGATLVLTPTFTPDLLLDTVEKERTTHFFGAPVAYLLTAGHPGIGEADLSSMKWWIYGSAPLSAPEVRKVQQAFRTDNLVCVYGLTEAGPSGTLMLGPEHAEKAGSIGRRAALYTEIRIVDDEGKDVKDGAVGEIVLRGEGTMIGYHNNDEATAGTFLEDGWLKTGDLAKFDEDGYIWVVDRKKDLIISGGVNIYPKEIEEAILVFPGIRETAVFGVPHPEWGETVKAVYAAEGEIDPEALKAHLAKRLASYKVPRLFEQLDELPRNASGKILKQVLKERVETT